MTVCLGENCVILKLSIQQLQKELKDLLKESFLRRQKNKKGNSRQVPQIFRLPRNKMGDRWAESYLKWKLQKVDNKKTEKHFPYKKYINLHLICNLIRQLEIKKQFF
jgi:hypothetical protein